MHFRSSGDAGEPPRRVKETRGPVRNEPRVRGMLPYSILSRSRGRSSERFRRGRPGPKDRPPAPAFSTMHSSHSPPGLRRMDAPGRSPVTSSSRGKTTPPTSGRPSDRVFAVHPCRGVHPPGQSPRQSFLGNRIRAPEIKETGGGDFRLPSPAAIEAAAPHTSKRITPIDRKMKFARKSAPEHEPSTDAILREPAFRGRLRS
jgi:hypothetical protein